MGNFDHLGDDPLESLDAPANGTPAARAESGHFADAATATRFMFAGKATFTLRSLKSGTRFTYRISASEDGAVHFVALLSGPDNSEDYQYLGIIRRGVYWHGKKSRVAADAPSVRAFDWTWRALASGHLPTTVEIWHAGACGRCGRPLTVPESIAAGFGPECINKIGG